MLSPPVVLALLCTLSFPLTLLACWSLRRAGVRWRWSSSSRGAGTAFLAALVCAYLVLNTGLSLLNRWALGVLGLRFPILMTSTHMIFGAWALTPMMTLSDAYAVEHRGVLRGQWRGLAAVAVLNGVQITANNASLAVMELSLSLIHI